MSHSEHDYDRGAPGPGYMLGKLEAQLQRLTERVEELEEMLMGEVPSARIEKRLGIKPGKAGDL